jgi:hypothetical protein
MTSALTLGGNLPLRRLCFLGLRLFFVGNEIKFIFECNACEKGVTLTLILLMWKIG